MQSQICQSLRLLCSSQRSGRGLTAIANAPPPGPAGCAVLKRNFPDSDIKAGGLLLCALPPTIIAIATLLEFALD
ncbi:MAG: hypothetical protein EAZ30_07780 [Betaproteobacteria bacterium]|nr:MAG: hypothetical protein EAZ30_07780 [Betaproteobacteria bacterium]